LAIDSFTPTIGAPVDFKRGAILAIVKLGSQSIATHARRAARIHTLAAIRFVSYQTI
jgi:hypothetical protein